MPSTRGRKTRPPTKPDPGHAMRMYSSINPCLLLAVLAGPGPLAAQTTPPAAEPKEDELLNLSPFQVSASASDAGRYASLEATSAGRIRTNIMDSSQSVSVITSELIQDIAPGRILEAAQYVAGVTESTLPNSWERTTMRGFLAEGRTVDGITYGLYPSAGFQNIDPAIIDRLEVVKGPNSILAPQPTSPGGTINLATKQPQFRNSGLIYLQVGEFDANSGFLDMNRVLNDKVAVRFVGSVRHWDNWWNGAYVHSTTLMPALTYRFSKKTQGTFQYTYTDWDASNYLGLPIDPASGTTTEGRLLAGVPRDLKIYPDDAVRTTRQHELKLLFSTELGPGIQMRFAAAYNTSSLHNVQINTGTSTGGAGGNVDPLTGHWNPGVRYQPAPPYAPSPIVIQPTRIFTRGGVEQLADPRQFNLQNDYAYTLENDSLKAMTLAGFAWSDYHSDGNRSNTLTAPNFDIDHPIDPTWTRTRLGTPLNTVRRFLQGYVSEKVALFSNRLILNGALSWQDYYNSSENALTGSMTDASTSTVLPSYGVVIKPAGDAVSLFYAYTEQSSANLPSSGETEVPPLSTSVQDEIGARFKVWHNRLYFTVSHYAIVQDNFRTPNPRNLEVPTPVPLLPSLYLDREAVGWEYELRASPAQGLSIIGSYTHFTNRDPNNVEFRGVAEKAGAVLVSYAFDRAHVPVLDGVRIAIGANYLGARPGDTPANTYTVAAPDRLIPVQPSFYLGARTLVNLTVAYGSKHHWSVQANVDNLLDDEYLMAANSRYAVFPGTPRNIRVSFRYRF